MRRAIAPLLLLLSACRADVDIRPTQADIEAIETKLSRFPCVGPKDSWFRAYGYETRLILEGHHQYHTQYINFVFEKAGSHHRPAGRMILTRDQLSDVFPYDKREGLILGTYDRTDHSIVIYGCPQPDPSIPAWVPLIIK